MNVLFSLSIYICNILNGEGQKGIPLKAPSRLLNYYIIIPRVVSSAAGPPAWLVFVVAVAIIPHKLYYVIADVARYYKL